MTRVTRVRKRSPGAFMALIACGLLAAAAGSAQAVEPPIESVIGGSPVGTPRVIGGAAAAPGDWPSVVALVRAGAGSPADRQFCGASAIAPRWVLTAAHCLFDAFQRQVEPADIRVIAGIHDLRADSAQSTIVTNLFIHPDYNHPAQDAYNDIALIEVATDLEVDTAALFGGDSDELGTADAHVVGWGATEFETPRRATYPDALQEAIVPLVPRAICNAPMSYAGYISGGQLCAGFAEGGVDSCVGDSGGPLFVDTGDGIEQVGVVSYGRGCAEPLFYGIYSNVSAYRSWIGEFIELPDAAKPAIVVENPRGVSGGVVGFPAEAPIARPEDLEQSNAPEPSLPSSNRRLFSGAPSAVGLLVLGMTLRMRRRLMRTVVAAGKL